MDPVIFKPGDTENSPKASGSDNTPALNLDTPHLSALPSLAIPAGTKGKRRKGPAIKTFFKVLILTYLALAAAGIAAMYILI